MARSEQPTLFELGEEPRAAEEIDPELDHGPVSPPEPVPEPPVPLQTRVFAGLVDVAIHLGVLALVVGSLRAMSIVPRGESLWALALLLVVFSLFYTVIPLAFWGRTPGMASVGLVARGADDVPLTFGQAGLRWLGSLGVFLSLGLLGLVSLTGRSLPDRLSRSRTELE